MILNDNPIENISKEFLELPLTRNFIGLSEVRIPDIGKNSSLVGKEQLKKVFKNVIHFYWIIIRIFTISEKYSTKSFNYNKNDE